MKINQLVAISVLSAIFFLSTGSRQNPNSPPTGKTGAPGETTCAQSSCHSGGTFVGAVSISGIPDTAIFGAVYPITITNASNAVRAGFQLTCLDSVNTKCGTLTSASGVNIGIGNGRQYARQSQPRNLSNGSASWTFNWTAPANAAGNKANFYFVSLCANNNGNTTGDNVLMNTKAVVLTALTATSSPRYPETRVTCYPSQVTSSMQVNLLDSNSGQISIYNAAGRFILQKTLQAENNLLLDQLRSGTYVAKIETPSGRASIRFVKL